MDLIEVDSIPIPENKTNISKITIQDSENLQFGPRFVGETINYFQNEKGKPQKYYATGMIVVGVIGLTCIVVALVILIKYYSTNDNQVIPIQEPSTLPSTLPSTKVTDITDVTTETTKPQPTVPSMWLIPYDEWSDDPRTCNDMVKKMARTISVESADGCRTLSDLKNLQEMEGLHYNFYIVEDGTIYEGYGWECAPEYPLRFSRSNSILAICGAFNDIQKTTFQMLLDMGTQKKHLNTNFNIVPECCRGFVDRFGPTRAVDEFLLEKFTYSQETKFINSQCIEYNRCLFNT